MHIKNLNLFPRLSHEFQTGSQINSPVECAKTMLQTFFWSLLIKSELR